MKWPSLDGVIDEAWDCFKRAGSLRMRPSMPVLFFGNIDTYCTSALRVLTVGLNPSSSEFPNSTFQRFERYGTERRPSNGRERRQYLEALSGYFCGHPYREWFDHLETLLNEIGASYYGKPKKPCTALHTDICSPVATQLRWSDLEQRDRDKLREDGAALWKALLQRFSYSRTVPTVQLTRRHRHVPGLEHHRSRSRHRPAVASVRGGPAQEHIAIHPGNRTHRQKVARTAGSSCHDLEPVETTRQIPL